jgi:hypothetical protein
VAKALLVDPDTPMELGTVQFVEQRGGMICLLIRPNDHKPYYAWLRQGETCNFLAYKLPAAPLLSAN